MKGADRIALVALVGVMTAACYTYRPIDSPSPGEEVRARLTAEAAARHSQGLIEPILHYDGVVVANEDNSLALDVLIARSASAFEDIEIRDTVRLDRAEIQSLMGRSLSVGKTVLFTVAAGVAAFAVVKGIDQVVGGTGDEDGDGTPGLRVPVPVPGGSILRLQLIVGRSP